MTGALEIALVGDYDGEVTAHRAIAPALQLAARQIGIGVVSSWLATEAINDAGVLEPFAGIWCVPGSPYRSTAGALSAIRYAREAPCAFLGTCGGFQHAVLEYARNVLGWEDAEHAEMTPHARRTVIAALRCALVETSERVRFAPGSRLAAAYGAVGATEGYRCSFGLDPRFAAELLAGGLHATAWDDAGEVRGLELSGHPFFVATLFQPERAALEGRVPPIVASFLAAARAGLRARTL
jgi:CTP synthase (UTP-ammonia lyase)